MHAGTHACSLGFILSGTVFVIVLFDVLQLGGVRGAGGSSVSRSCHHAGGVAKEDCNEGGQETDSENPNTQSPCLCVHVLFLHLYIQQMVTETGPQRVVKAAEHLRFSLCPVCISVLVVILPPSTCAHICFHSYPFPFSAQVISYIYDYPPLSWKQIPFLQLK